MPPYKLNKPLIITILGGFVTSKFKLNAIIRRNLPYKFFFKKQFFSFLAPNQIKKSILARKKRIVVSRFFKTPEAIMQKYNYFNYHNKNLLLSFTSYYNLHNNLGAGSYAYYSDNITMYDSFSNRGVDDSFKYNEVFIKRIRFKPGYQRLWRRARNTLKESLGLRYKYQYRLTRYLMRFSRKINNYFLDTSELSLTNLVLYSKLLPDTQSLKLFLENQLIYLNGKLVLNQHQLIYTNDLVQLVVSKWYYVFSR